MHITRRLALAGLTMLLIAVFSWADVSTSGNTDSPNSYFTVPFTNAFSTAKCTIPAGPAAVVTKTVNTPLATGTSVHAKAAHRFQP